METKAELVIDYLVEVSLFFLIFTLIGFLLNHMEAITMQEILENLGVTFGYFVGKVIFDRFTKV
ncbi:MAG: hypothetical protein ACRCXZ_04740 [Patescibacteria group bacterium]